MSAPDWLVNLLATAMLAIMALFVWRLAVSRAWQRPADHTSDAFHALAALALAGMLVGWTATLPRAAWAAVFAAGAVYFALHWAHARTTGRAARSRDLVDAATSAVLVYMLLAGVAPSVLSRSTAGLYVMAGMPGMIKDNMIHYPALGMVFAVAAIGYVVVLLDRVSQSPRPAPLPDGAPARPTPLTPRLAECCRLFLLATIAYAIFAKVV
ncbi:DUF5134 domain-containing protein [Streptacidiphilus sp. 4-A2]|nr:DUF5134 domain-containing protein [Streptacidiphilus sp. 4-A2]